MRRGEGTLGGRRGYNVLALVATVAFGLLAARLWYLQVLRGDHYYRRSANNFLKERTLPATRGLVLDRNGRILVDNRPGHDVHLTPRFVTDESLERVLRMIRLEGDAASSLRAKIASKKGLDRYQSILTVEDVPRNDAAQLESHKLELPGVTVDVRPRRFYPNGKLAAHLLGYMNQVSSEELGRLRDQGYRATDAIGRSGIERQWESFLRGKDGQDRVFVDAKGHTQPDFDRREIEALAATYGGPRHQDPIAGKNVVLTIDLDTQRTLEKAIGKHHSGAGVVVEVDSGRILAMASHPAFDPNLLTGHLSHADDERLQNDPFRPLIDKVLRENYYPGSTFKIIPALAALEDHLIDADEMVACKGDYRLPGHTFRCMKSHGPMTLHSAMVESCNIYFYHLAEQVGLDRMARLAADFGLGAATGLGLNGEVAGFIPSQDYYREHGGFRIGHTLNTAIGQGSTKVTVLQLALAYAAIANGGDLYVPQLVDRIEGPAGQVVQAFAPKLRRKVAVGREHLDRVRRMLCGVVNDPKGTVYEAREATLPVEVCGKSGTAQVRKNRRGEAPGWDVGNDHAWFASFAPAVQPKVVVVILIEHGGLGGHVAAPAALEVYRAYFAEPKLGLSTDLGAPRREGARP